MTRRTIQHRSPPAPPACPPISPAPAVVPIGPLVRGIDDTCTALGLSRTSVYDLIAAGHLEAVRSGRRTLVLETSIRSYLASLPRLELRRPAARSA